MNETKSIDLQSEVLGLSRHFGWSDDHAGWLLDILWAAARYDLCLIHCPTETNPELFQLISAASPATEPRTNVQFGPNFFGHLSALFRVLDEANQAHAPATTGQFLQLKHSVDSLSQQLSTLAQSTLTPPVQAPVAQSAEPPAPPSRYGEISDEEFQHYLPLFQELVASAKKAGIILEVDAEHRQAIYSNPHSTRTRRKPTIYPICQRGYTYAYKSVYNTLRKHETTPATDRRKPGRPKKAKS